MVLSAEYRSSSNAVINNPDQPIEITIMEALADRQARQEKLQTLKNDNQAMAKIAKEMRREREEAYDQLLRPLGADIRAYWESVRRAAARENAIVAEILKDRARKWYDLLDFDPSWIKPAKPLPLDPSFWWARTEAYGPSSMQVDIINTTMRFSGGPKVDDFDGEERYSFGIRAFFALQPERLPQSPSGWYRSSPHVELQGGVTGHAPDSPALQGDGISECKLSLRQSILQNRISPTGPKFVTIAEARAADPWYYYLKNRGAATQLDLPGFKPMPAVDFHQSQFNAHEEIWCELEVNFDIYLNTAGALLWCEPQIYVPVFQWPLIALP